jgi:hypothetical protein
MTLSTVLAGTIRRWIVERSVNRALRTYVNRVA